MPTILRQLKLLRLILSRIPLALKTAAFHGLRIFAVTKKQDLRTELVVAIIRSFVDESMSITEQQGRFAIDLGSRGPRWISEVTIPAPGDGVRAAILQAFNLLSESEQSQGLRLPDVVPVEAEWIGNREKAVKKAQIVNMSEKEKYEALKAEVKSDMVILYIHGGAL